MNDTRTPLLAVPLPLEYQLASSTRFLPHLLSATASELPVRPCGYQARVRSSPAFQRKPATTPRTPRSAAGLPSLRALRLAADNTLPTDARRIPCCAAMTCMLEVLGPKSPLP